VEAAEARYEMNYKNSGAEHHSTQSALQSLALICKKAGKLEKAAEALEKAYAVKVAKDGDSFISTGPNGTRRADDTLLEDMVSVYNKLGGNARGIQLGEKLCDVRIEIYGKEHSKTLAAMTYLGYLYSQDGQDQKALEIMQQVYQLRVKVSGEEAPATLTVLNNLAVLNGNVGEHRTALTLQQKVYELRRKVQGESHPHTLQALRNLVCAYAWAEEYKTALEYAEVSYVLHCQVHGPDHANTLAAREMRDDMKKRVEEGF
jgi:tetratricopeptide (TPR) repeat protein